MKISQWSALILILVFGLAACTAPLVAPGLSGMSPQEMQRYLDNLTNTAQQETRLAERERSQGTKSAQATLDTHKRDTDIINTQTAAKLTQNAAAVAPILTLGAATTTKQFEEQNLRGTQTTQKINDKEAEGRIRSAEDYSRLVTVSTWMMSAAVVAVGLVLIFLIVQSRNFFKALTEIVLKWFELRARQTEIVRMNEEFYQWWDEQEKRYQLSRYASLPAPAPPPLEPPTPTVLESERENILEAHRRNLERLVFLTSLMTNRDLIGKNGRCVPYDRESGRIGWSLAALEGRDIIHRPLWEKYTDALMRAKILVKAEREPTRWHPEWSSERYRQMSQAGQLCFAFEGEKVDIAPDSVVIHCPTLKPVPVKTYTETRTQPHSPAQAYTENTAHIDPQKGI